MKKILFSLIFIGIFTSCHDSFLEEKSYSQISIENSFKTAEDAVMAVNGAYTMLAGENYYDNIYMLLADGPADQMLTEWNNPLDNYVNLNNTNKDVQSFWNAAWKVNAQTNMIMEKVPNIEMDLTLKNRVLGEASFIRALNYFHLVRFFGNIPLITKTTTEVESMKVEQVSSEKIYEQIILDLEFASKNLPEIYEGSDLGRATSWAAKALLAKVYLTMAGYHADPATSELIKGDKENYKKCADLCHEIITSGKFDLFENFADIYENENENIKEDIFSIQYLDGAGGYNGGVGTTKTPRFVPKGSKLAAVEWKTYAVEKMFYENFPNDDRKAATFLVSYLDENDALVTIPSAVLPYPFVRKFLSDIHEGSDKQYKAVDGKDYGDNYIVLRYADVLLMYSEALNDYYGPEYNNGEIENTLYGINKVRKRAGSNAYTLSDCNTDQDVLRTMILDERCWELCFEGHGWFDYVRHGVLIERLLMAGRAINVAQHNYLMPIPFNATQTNKLLKQNNGY